MVLHTHVKKSLHPLLPSAHSFRPIKSSEACHTLPTWPPTAAPDTTCPLPPHRHPRSKARPSQGDKTLLDLCFFPSLRSGSKYPRLWPLGGVTNYLIEQSCDHPIEGASTHLRPVTNSLPLFPCMAAGVQRWVQVENVVGSQLNPNRWDVFFIPFKHDVAL